MQDVALRYEQRASGASFDLNTMTFGSGSSGRRIDIEAAIPLIDDALRRPTNRRVTLPLKTESAKDRNMATLKAAITDYLNNFVYLGSKGMTIDGPATVVGLVAIDLQSGAELSINPKVAFGAASTIKLPILVSAFRQIVFEPNNDLKWLMAASILCSSNSGSNFTMQSIGNGNDPSARLRDGLSKVNETMQGIGAGNTYINAPLFVADRSYEFSIPAPKTNPDKTLNTKPDPFNQTTAEDMANTLLGLYECSEYNSGLRTFFPDGYTQSECKQALELLSGNKIGRLIELGIPAGTRIAHKNGWAGSPRSGAVVGDAAIVYSPGGAYVLVVYVWESRATEDGRGSLDAWRALEGISRITYNYFNPEQPVLVARTPENELGAIDCVMPNPNYPERVDFNNINNGRFAPSGELVPDACVNYPACLSNPNASTKKEEE
jgi:beta-lactamase class A